MSQGLFGALAGMGKGLADAGDTMTKSHLEKQRMAIQARIRGEERAENQAFQKEQAAQEQTYRQGEAEKNRKHDLAMAEKEFGQQKDLADYKLTTELKLAREKAESSGELSDWQNANLDRINGSIDNLQKMERDLMTGKTDGMDFSMLGPEAGAEPKDSAEKLALIRQRLKAEEIKFNRVLGNQKGVDTGMAVLSQAANVTDEQDKQEFLAEFRKSKTYSEDLERQISEVWGSRDKPTQKVEASQPGENTVLAPDQAPQGNEQPQGGLISEASAPQDSAPKTAPVKDQGPQPTADERPGKNPRPPSVNSNEGKPFMDKKLGPAIEEGAREVGRFQKRMTEKQRKFSLQQLENIAVRDGSKLSPTAKAQILQAHGRAIKDASPEVIEQLKAIFGAEAIEKYLN